VSDATRPILWNISAVWMMYVLFALAVGVFVWGLARRVAQWRKGRADDERLGDWWLRLRLLIKEIFSQRRVRRRRVPGVFHGLIFYSFIVLLVATTVVALDYDFGTSLFQGWFYAALTIGADLAGALILVGLAVALWRRVKTRPTSLPTSAGDWVSLSLLGLMVVTGFAVEGLRIATLEDPWRWLSPIGLLFAQPFAGLSADTGRRLHQGLWWGHTAIAMAWIAAIPYTKFFHLLALPTNIFFQQLGSRGQLQREDLEALMMADDFDEENFRLGIETSNDFRWKHRLDFDACVECGRCEDACPASQSGADFSPRDFIARCKTQLATRADDTPLVGEAVDEPYVWQCRLCAACMEVCPAAIDHVPTLVDVRRNEVLMQGRVPDEAARMLRALENQGNPFGPPADRTAWVADRQVRVVGPGEQVDVLYWSGCYTAVDETKRQIANDLCALLEQAGVDFGVLGADEGCCGDPACVVGDERLFQERAKEQVEQLNSRRFRILLTSCPHCYNVLANEYPQFGGHLRVLHHSQFLDELIEQGRLVPQSRDDRKFVYHDPCFLGRYQGIYDAPRNVLGHVGGEGKTEMRDSRQNSLCCGGGGGHFWMEMEAPRRIGDLRVQQAVQAGADCIVTGCAYCKQMLEDSVKSEGLSEPIEVTDLATLTLSHVARAQPPAQSVGDPR